MIIEVQITFPDKESACRIAERLLDERLVACVQIAPIESFYVWEGKREHASEWLATAKTCFDQFPRILPLVESLHPYQCPQITAVEILGGNRKYLGWIIDNTIMPPKSTAISLCAVAEELESFQSI